MDSVILAGVPIEAILFDLGGVLLRTADFTPREQLAARLGMTRHQMEEFVFGGESGERAQRGEITIQQHWQNLADQLHISRKQLQAILDEFFAQDELDLAMLDYIRQLHRRYKTALLSNAWEDLREVIAERFHFEDAFDEIVISAEVGLVKPDRRIFTLALELLGVGADRAIFVDDMPRNVDGACQVGMHAIRFASFAQVQQEIECLLDDVQGD